MNFFLILTFTALFQILGFCLTYFTAEKIRKHRNLILWGEIIVMFLISAEIIFFSAKESWYSLFGIWGGIFLIMIFNRIIPHKHHQNTFEKLGTLVFIGMCIHEFPEGIAFGSTFLLDGEVGLLTSILIALHNLPEGTIVAMPFILKNQIKHALYLTVVTQVLYVIGGLAAYKFLFSVSSATQAIFASMAAGIMIYIAFEETKFLK